MRFRMGLLVGFAGGYVLGAKAGKERYEQIRRTAERAWGSQPADKLRSTAASAAGDVGQKAAEAVRSLRHRDGDAEDVARRTEPFVAAASSPRMP